MREIEETQAQQRSKVRKVFSNLIFFCQLCTSPPGTKQTLRKLLVLRPGNLDGERDLLIVAAAPRRMELFLGNVTSVALSLFPTVFVLGRKSC